MNASPARRFWTLDGEILTVTEGVGMTHAEALNEVRWELLNRRLSRVEVILKEVLAAVRSSR